jgi:hypothetical protein
MSSRLRNIFLYGALAATLAAVWWSQRLPEDEDTVVESTERVKPVIRADQPASSAAHAGLKKPVRLTGAKLDAFAPRDWTPPPPPPPKYTPPPPPPPMAPPLPYRYLGKLQEQDHLVVFLDNNTRPIPIKGGEVLDGVWRVDDITPRMVRFTYIPLAQTATLNIGEAL